MSININSVEYEIIKQLGGGGYGKVNLVLNKSDNKNYALKEIPIKDETKENIEKIKKEAEILSKFNHKNIVKYYASFELEDKFYILMEYCDGKDINYIINKHKKKSELIEEKLIYFIIYQICLGIKEIHNKQVIHRDLKPENIFMNKNNEIKIGDFGISKELNSYKKYTKTNKKQGTLYYTSPEILNEGIYNDKADIWSLGCIIYELFHLSTHFLDNMMQDIKQIDNQIYNQKWQDLIDSLLQIDYNNRPDINYIVDFISCDELKKIDNNDDSNKNSNEINNNVYNLDKKVKIKKIIRKLNKAEINEITKLGNLKRIRSKYKSI